tara:strand:- start:486 stop:974 length:489 start_codon:yes stop_codon:yes gene_type:complete
MHIRLKNKYLYFYNYKIKCSIGKRGLTYKKKEGDLKTPRGKYNLKFLFYRKDRIKKIDCRLKKIRIEPKMGWCDEPFSRNYNKLIKFPFYESAEKLYLKSEIYDLILVLDFNMRPIISNKGSAIFLHVASKKFLPTKGCIAIKKDDFLKILPKIKDTTALII